ncbi:MAG: response regulator [candidate division Zixibacteria bacterium]
MKYHNILLVDDSPNVLKALKRIFRLTAGYTIFSAESGHEALGILENHEIDILITDENMPKMTGTELLNTIRVLYPQVIRFMLTGQSDIEIAKKAINNGEIYRFFTKPCDDFELLIAVRYALERKNLEIENAKLQEIVKRQENTLRNIASQHPELLKL